MKKWFKISILLCMCIIACLLVGCGAQTPKKTYTYGVISFREVDGKSACYAYVPAKYCGDVRIYLDVDYITYPKEMKDGDLVKMTFSGDLQIRELGDNKFFARSPDLIEICGSGVKIQENGASYEVSFPSNKVGELTENCTIIDIYKDKSLIYSINNFSVVNENVIAKIDKDDIFKVLENYQETFIAK